MGLSAFTENAILLLLVIVIADLQARTVRPSKLDARASVIRGTGVGVFASLTMLIPLRLEPGILLDSRGLILAISGTFFGPLVTAVAVGIAMVSRLAIGGSGTMNGVAFIIYSALIGLALRTLREKKVDDIRWYELLGLGGAVAAFQIVVSFNRVAEADRSLVSQLSPGILAVSAIVTLALGRLIQRRNDQARMLSELADRENSFRTLTENLPAIVYRAALDELSTTLYVSPAIRSLGYSAEEWMANPELFANCLHPDDRDHVLEQLAADRAANRGSDLTYRLRHADGSWRIMRDIAVIVRHQDGSELFLQGLMTDTTAERATQEQLVLQDVALKAAADAIVILDPDANIIWANPAFERMTRYDVREAVGKNPRQLLRSGRQGREFYTQMWDTLLAGDVWSGRLVNRRRDGTEYTEEQTITPLRDDAGQLTHFIAVKRDVTDRVQMEAQLQQSQRLESVGRLAGGVAHDFNNLLTVVNASVEMALPLVEPGTELEEDLKAIRTAADRGVRLTRQLLAFSRQQVLRAEILDLNDVVQEMSGLFRRVLGERVDVQLHLAPALDKIRADSGQLSQVLMNLVVNARDAMPDGGIISITTENVAFEDDIAARHVSVSPGAYVGLYVTDNGTGMDSATRDRIFEPFFTTKAAGKGTGLGLPTAYGIIKQSGGSVWVYSEPGRGTTFKLYFPTVEDGAEERPSGAHAAVGVEQGLDGGGTETVLVVEDEDAIRLVATKVLTRKGYHVIAAESGEAALAMLEAQPIAVDLLVTDMVMPGMTGPELAVQMRQRQPALKVLFTSGYSREAVAQQFGLADGHFIAKPYGLAALTSAVRGVLDSGEKAVQD